MSRRKKQGMLGAVIAVAALVLVFQLALGMDPTTVFADDSGLTETQTVDDAAASQDDVATSGEEAGSADASAQSPSPAQSFEVTADNNVVVKVDAPEGALPEGVELHADVVTETEDVASELDNAGVSYDGFVALDVYFTSSDGTEVEPAQAVDVRFELPSGLVPEDAESVSVQHLAEDETGAVTDVQTVADNSDAATLSEDSSADKGTVSVNDDSTVTAEFSVDGFSSFSITWGEWGTTYAQIRVEIVDENGEKLTSTTSLPDSTIDISWLTEDQDEISIDSYSESTQVDGYSFLEARYNNQKVTRLVATKKGLGWGRYSRTVTFYNGNDSIAAQTCSDGEPFQATIQLVYQLDEPEQTADLYIEDTISSDGLFRAVFNDAVAIPEDATVEYTWYRSLTGTDGTWQEVTIQRVTGTQDNLVKNGQAVNVAYDSIAANVQDSERYWYYVEAKVVGTDGQESIYKSDPLQVPYYIELQNGSFESPVADSWNNQLANGTEGLIWMTTGTNSDGRDIEIANTVDPKYASSGTDNYHISSAADGNQFAELNCEAYGALYQDVLTVPDASLNWSLEHAGRAGTDTMALVIMSAEDADVLTGRLQQIANAEYSTDSFETADEKRSAAIRQALEDAREDFGAHVEYFDGVQGSWTYHSGDYDVPDGQYLTRFFFVSVATASGGGQTVGNLLDDIGFGTDVPDPRPGEGQITVTKTVEGYVPDENYQVKITVKDSETGSDEVASYTFSSFQRQADGSYAASHTFTFDIEQYQSKTYLVSEEVDGSPENYVESSFVSVGSDKESEGTESVATVKGGGTQTVSFTNSYEVVASYGVFIYKGAAAEDVDGSTIADPKKPLAGATFTVTDEDGTVVATGETNPDGFLSLGGNLSSGTYTISETQVPAGYTLLGYDIILQINEDGSAKFTMNGQEVDAETVSDANPTAAVSYPDSSDYFYLALANYEDDPIPSTGGMGNAPLYVVGAVAVAGSVIALRRRQQTR